MKNNDKVIVISEKQFAECIKQNMSLLHSYALSLTRDHNESLDLLQETLMRAYVKRKKYKEDNNFKGWLMAIMKNLFLSRYRQLLKLPDQLTSEKSHYFINQVRNTKNLGIENMSLIEINKEIQNLSEKYRRSFLMYFSGFKYSEIAERIGVPIGTVKHRIHRARKILKDRMRLCENYQAA